MALKILDLILAYKMKSRYPSDSLTTGSIFFAIAFLIMYILTSIF